jgi:hypothetical protein
MSTAVAESPLSLFAGATRPPAEGGAQVTLEERLDAAWRAVRHDGHAECPVCSASMRDEAGAARCSGCGSVLS